MLKDYLDNKPIFYDEIDYSRFPNIYDKIKTNFNQLKNIHIIGTNGKGTTGRFLASALNSLGFKVGHYTSPHILKFNERVWLNGSNVSDVKLEEAHLKLQTILTKEDSESLSYFEYTTLLAQLIFSKCDYVVLEAGLGGEYDASAVFPKILTLLTPVDIDHEFFLGSTIKEIATTKLNAVQNNLIVGYQNYDEVMQIANDLVTKKDIVLKTINELLDEKDMQNIKFISKDLKLASYLEQNLSLSISALKFLGIDYSVEDFKDARLFGRLTPYKSNIILDVGHNILASSSILEALNKKKYVLIYNSYKDKNYKEILNILKPIIVRVEIINVDDDRIELKSKLQKTIKDIGLKCKDFKTCNDDEDYLVFGSFSVVEAFLKEVQS
ncbi:MAG: bifunctional folylpolyglutamate synthase/dihydrofolate synthase [Campylobacterales bacterium]